MKKQIFPLLISLGFLCSFFSVQAVGELSPVQPGRGYLADGVNDYVVYDNFDGSMIGNEITFQYRYEEEADLGVMGIWGAVDKDGYRYDIYLRSPTQIRIFVKGTTSSSYYFYTVPTFITDDVYNFKVTWTAVSTAPTLTVNGVSYVGEYSGGASLSVTVSKYYLYTIGAGIGNTSYSGKSGISNIQVKRSSDGKLLHSWHCDEGSGTTSFDSVKEWNEEDELLDSGFDDPSKWLTHTGWSVANGVATKVPSDSNASVYQSVLKVGKRYRWVYKVNSVNGSVQRYGAAGVTIRTSPGIYEEEDVATSTLGGIRAANSTTAEIEYCHIYEIHEPAHGTITNATESTFHTVDTDFKSYQNEVGYSEDSGVLVPVALDQNGKALKQDINGNDATYTGRTRTEAALVGKNVAVFDGVDDYVDTGEDFIGTKAVTITGWIKPYSFGEVSGGRIIDNDKLKFLVFGTDSKLLYYSDGSTQSASATSSISLNKWQFIVVTRTAAGVVNFYIGNQTTIPALSGSADQNSGTPTSGTTNVIIGNRIGTDRTFDGSISDLKIYEGIATEQQIQDVWAGKDISLERIAAYPLAEGAGTTVYDTVPTYYGDDLVTNGRFHTGISGWTASSAGVIEWELDGSLKAGINAVGIAGGGLQELSLEVGKKYKVMGKKKNVTGTTGVSVNIVNNALDTFVYRDTDSVSTSWTDVEYTFTATETNSYIYARTGNNHNEYGFFDDLSVEEAHEPLNGTVTNVDLDTFWTTDMDAEDQNLVNGYTPGLMNATAGTAYIVNKQAYGTWEFDVYKGNDANVYLLYFLKDDESSTTTGSGYLFQVDQTEVLRLRIQTNGSRSELFQTVTSYISNNTWYRVKIQRNQTLNQYHTGAIGSFAVYIKGGDFGDDYVLVTPVSGANPVVDNTYTTSAYSVLDLDAGDQVAGFMANNKIVDFHSFTEGTGSYNRLSLPAQAGQTAKDVNNNRLTYNPQDLRYTAMAYNNVAVFDGTDDVVSLPATSAFSSNDSFSSFAWIRKVAGNQGTIWRSNSHTGMDFWNNATYFRGMVSSSACSGWSNQFKGYPDDGKWHHVGMTYDHVNMKLYVDGVLKQTFPFVCDLGLSVPMSVGTYSTSSFGGNISDLRMYNRALSATEVEELYQGSKTVTAGLVAQYPLSEGAGLTAYNAAPISYGPNLVQNGQFYGDGEWTKGTGATISGGSVNFVSSGVDALYQDGGIANGKKYKVTFDVSSYTSGSVTAWAGGSQSSTSNVAFNTTGAKEILLDLTGETTSNGNIVFGGTGSSFTGSIDNVSVQEIYEPVHGTITNTTTADFWKIDNTLPFSQAQRNGFSEGLVNTTAGTAYTPSDVAYGEWEFDVKVSSGIGFYFISDRSNTTYDGGEGYYLIVGVNGRISMGKNSVGSHTNPFYTSVDYITNNTWYRIKITRSLAGEFSVYIKGGEFGDDYVLVSTAGGSGSNPVTDTTYATSNYFVTDLDAGDQIANVQIDGHRASVHEFEKGTGVYEKIFLPAQTGRGMDVLGNILQVKGEKTNLLFTTTDLAILTAKKLARKGINYWNVATKKFFTGRADGSLEDFVPDTTRMKTTAELTAINSAKTASEGSHYWDTTLRKFLRGLTDGTLVDFLTWYAGQ